MQSIYFILVLLFITSNAIRFKVIHTSILEYFPLLKLHHIIVLSNSTNKVYTIDFTPNNQEKIITQLKLLSSCNVAGEIRVHMIKDVDFNNDEEIVNKWIEYTEKSNGNIYDSEVNTIIKQVKEEWSQDMNLYTHNCQHFSHYFIKRFMNYNM